MNFTTCYFIFEPSYRAYLLPYFLTYVPVGVIGALTNAFLIFLQVKKTINNLERKTFQKLIWYLTLTDFSLMFYCLVDLIHHNLIDKDAVIFRAYWYSLRNILLASQSICLLLIAIDRFLAVVKPLNTKYFTKPIVVRVFIGFQFIVVTFDFGLRTIEFTTRNCHVSKLAYQIYMVLYGTFAAMFITACAALYIVLFTFYVFCRVAGGITNCNNSNNGGCYCCCCIDNHSRDSIHSEFSDHDNGNMKGTIKLAKVLLASTILYTITLIPCILSNVGLIDNPDYTLYFTFYFNALGNSLLYFAASPQLRKQIKILFNGRV